MTGACIYQIVHTLGGRPLHLAEHAEVLDEASRTLFGWSFRTDELDCQIAKVLASLPRTDRSVFIRLSLNPERELDAEPGGVSLYRGYALRSLTPDAVSLRYDLPFGDYPTSARDALGALALVQAQRRNARCVVRCDSSGRVLTGDDAPLFAVRGAEVFTTPTVRSVERSVAASCIAAAGLTLTERTVTQDELSRFDELFFFDHRGVTALARCDGHPYMALAAERVARKAAELTSEF